jgi:hypothetical protein
MLGSMRCEAASSISVQQNPDTSTIPMLVAENSISPISSTYVSIHVAVLVFLLQ